MRIKWLEDSIGDLKALREYIEKDNPSAANRVAKRIISTVELLAEQPNMGRPGRVPKTRELVLKEIPYIIPYRVKNEVVEILRVFHAARQWPGEF